MLVASGLAEADTADPASASTARLTEHFIHEVDHRIEVPVAEQRRYIAMLAQSLTESGISGTAPEAFVLVDRSPSIQAAFVVLRTVDTRFEWVGATAVSTGKSGTYDHFLTPLGVFDHTPDHPDFRAEGTFNKNHIRGYGLHGRRVFDFGWQNAERGWGDGGVSEMRLQMHATDPNILEARLGTIASEGCIRIPATLNVFLDHYGILDDRYEAAVVDGKPQWILKRDRQTIGIPGRYLVIVDSRTEGRPDWSPAPGSKALPVAPSTAPQKASGQNAPA